MNTKTMRLPPRRVLTHSTTASGSGTATTTTNNKRKDRADSLPVDRPRPRPEPVTTKLLKPDKPTPALEPTSRALEPTPTPTPTPSPSNQLLAGYLAHEYLTRGTLFGQPWTPSRAEERKAKLIDGEEEGQPRRRAAAAAEEEEYERYLEVTGLLKGDGAHLPGVVNPTVLARFLHL